MAALILDVSLSQLTYFLSGDNLQKAIYWTSAATYKLIEPH